VGRSKSEIFFSLRGFEMNADRVRPAILVEAQRSGFLVEIEMIRTSRKPTGNFYTGPGNLLQEQPPVLVELFCSPSARPIRDYLTKAMTFWPQVFGVVGHAWPNNACRSQFFDVSFGSNVCIITPICCQHCQVTDIDGFNLSPTVRRIVYETRKSTS
jgi:hypothetical protein